MDAAERSTNITNMDDQEFLPSHEGITSKAPTDLPLGSGSSTSSPGADGCI
jgi:hypothetical protein